MKIGTRVKCTVDNIFGDEDAPRFGALGEVIETDATPRCVWDDPLPSGRNWGGYTNVWAMPIYALEAV